MSFDGLMMSAVVAELNQTILPARVNKVYQPTEHTLLFHLYARGRSGKLLVSADSRRAMLHLTTAAYQNPPSPPGFCSLLRRHLEGARLTGCEQPGLERLCLLRFTSVDDVGMPRELALACELMGRFSNLLLLEKTAPSGSGTSDSGWRIMDAIRRSSPADNPIRPVLPGLRYAPPPSGDKIDPVLENRAAILEKLRQRLEKTEKMPAWQFLQSSIKGLGATLAREIIFRTGADPAASATRLTPECLKTMIDCLLGLALSPNAPGGSDTEDSPCLAEIPGRFSAYAPIFLTHLNEYNESLNITLFPTPSLLLDQMGGRLEEEEKTRELRSKLTKTVRSELARAEKKLAQQEAEIREAERAEDYRIKGELLLANLNLVSQALNQAAPGADRLTLSLPNWYDPEGGSLDVELDRRLEAADQAQAYFKRYRKAKKTLAQATVHRDRTRNDLAYLNQVEASLTSSATIEEYREINDELVSQGYLKERPGKTAPNVKPQTKVRGARRQQRSAAGEGAVQATLPLRFTSSDGLIILVGKNNRQNDYLTMKLAGAPDVWLHAKEIPGSHVIIRLNPGQTEAPERTLSEAANLAAYYSQARVSSQVPVDFTHRRNVWKPSGARPGMVLYDHQRTLYVTPDPELVHRLAPNAGNKTAH